MNRLTKKLATALIGLGALSGSLTEADACPGGGGGRSYGGYRPTYYQQQRYVQPAQPRPYYQQPEYRQPTGGYGDSTFGRLNPQFAAQPSHSISPNGLPPTVKKMANVRRSRPVNPQLSQGGQFNAQQPSGQQFNGQPSGGQQFSQEQPSEPQFAGQPTGGQPGVRRTAQRSGGQPARQAGGQASMNALQALGGSPIQSQGQPQAGPTQGGQQQLAQSQDDQGQFVQEQGGQSQAAPRRQMARRPQSQVAQQQQPQSQPESQPEPTSPMDEAQLSALEALGGLVSEQPEQLNPQDDQPEQTEAFAEEAEPVQASPTSSNRPSNQPMHVGRWNANLQNGSKVTLTLQPDGNFSWVATSGEKVSSFDGNYTVSGGSLTLVRSSDNQKLIGAMTPAGSSSFTFKLTGTKDSGLNFSRS